MSKSVMVLLYVLTACLLLAVPFAVASPEITEEARMANQMTMDEDEDFAGDWDEDFEEDWEEDWEEDLSSLQAPQDNLRTRGGVQPLAVIASAIYSDILPAAGVDALPVDLFTPGSTPIEENYTENGYRDDTIIVEMEQRRMYDSDVYIAFVKIATPSQLRTAIAGKKMSSGSTNLTTTISRAYNGIVAVNGDYYTKTKAGYIVRQGQTYREKTSKNMDLLLIDELGDFHIILHGHDRQAEGVQNFLSQHTLVNGFFFGPALVKDGEVQKIPENYQFAAFSKNPRAGIAQLDVLTYAIVVVNGRTVNSEGVRMEEFAQIMKEIGAQQAYNLDGGNSATLAFHGQVYNSKPQDERSVTDIIYFASAIGE